MNDTAGKSNGAIIGAIVIIIILVAGGVYLSRQEDSATEPVVIESVDDLTPTETVEATSQAEVDALSNSTDVVDIEADLAGATDLTELEAELDALEAELQAE